MNKLTRAFRHLITAEIKMPIASDYPTPDMLMRFFADQYSLSRTRHEGAVIVISSPKKLIVRGIGQALSRVCIEVGPTIKEQVIRLNFGSYVLTCLFYATMALLIGIVVYLFANETWFALGPLFVSGFFAACSLLVPFYSLVIGRIVRLQLSRYVQKAGR